MKIPQTSTSNIQLACRKRGLFLLIALLFGMAENSIRAQVSYTANEWNYAQSFDSLPATNSVAWTDNGTLPGWYALRVIPNLPPVTCQADNGSMSPSGILYSYGTGSQSDRAFGILPGSTPGDCYTGVRFTNATTNTFTSVTIQYSGEQWRVASTTPRTLTVDYKVGSSSSLNDNSIPWVSCPGLSFTSPVTSATPGPLDGNAAPNRYAGISVIIPGLSWGPGTDLWVRFDYPDVNPGQGLAIDSFNFSASTDPYAVFKREAIATVAEVDTQLASGPAGALQVRDLGMAAYICLALDYPDPGTAITKAQTYLNDMFTKQDTTTGSSTVGHFYWNYTDTAVTDENSTDFCLKSLAVILKRYSGKLGAPYVSSISTKTGNALAAAMGRSVPVYYTNINTMRMVSWTVLGEALGNTAAQSAGAAAINAWIADLQSEYIHEYDSPTYTPVTYGNLLIGANNITLNGVAADQCRSLLDLVGADLSANYFNGQEKMGGSHSRDYDFTVGSGSIDHFYYLEGLRASAPDYKLKSDGLFFYLNALEGGYRTPADILSYGDDALWPTRVVRSIWGTLPGQDRYHYVTPDFSIGSSGTYYGLTHDKAIAADLASSQVLGQISLVYDPYDLPYASITPEHLPFAAANVQGGPNVLSLANLSPATNTFSSYTNISASVLFPAAADHIYLNGVGIAPSGTHTAALNDVLGVRAGNAVVAARFFLVDPVSGYTPTYAVKFDDPAGVSARFVAYLYQGIAIVPISGSFKPRIGMVMAAQQCTSDAAVTNFLASVKSAPITVTGTTNQWGATVTLGGIALQSTQCATNNAIVSRTVGGAAYTPVHFKVGQDLPTDTDLNAGWLLKIIDSGWIWADIGSLPSPSTASYNSTNATTSVTSTGGDYWTAADAGQFTFRPISGDCDIVARVDSLSGGQSWTKGGVMIRETLDPDAKCAMTYLTPGNGARISYRSTTGGTQVRTGATGLVAPYWVRLTRVGDAFTSYVRSDSTTTWTVLKPTPTTTSVTIPMNQAIYAGFAVTSCTTTSTTAIFSHASVN